jgi:hypothetical protein
MALTATEDLKSSKRSIILVIITLTPVVFPRATSAIVVIGMGRWGTLHRW